MSASNKQAGAAVTTQFELNDAMVRDYLKANDDFLQRNPELLDELQVAHASGSAISLVEKQVSVLRERNMDMRHRLKALTDNARENDRLYEQTRRMVLQLLEARSLPELYTRFMQGMTGGFGVDHACMIIYGEGGDADGWREESPQVVHERVGHLIRKDKCVSGALRSEELRFLFPHSSEAGSAALAPLTSAQPLGLIAAGSADPGRYHSGVGTLFLEHIAEVIVRLLPGLRRPQG